MVLPKTVGLPAAAQYTFKTYIHLMQTIKTETIQKGKIKALRYMSQNHNVQLLHTVLIIYGLAAAAGTDTKVFKILHAILLFK